MNWPIWEVLKGRLKNTSNRAKRKVQRQTGKIKEVWAVKKTRSTVPGPHRIISRREETQKSYIRNWHGYSGQSNGGRSTSGGDTRLAGSIHASSRSRNVWCHGTDWVCLFLVTRTKIPRLPRIWYRDSSPQHKVTAISWSLVLIQWEPSRSLVFDTETFCRRRLVPLTGFQHELYNGK